MVFQHVLGASLTPEPTGRAVTMNADGSDIAIEHVDIYLRVVEGKVRGSRW